MGSNLTIRIDPKLKAQVEAACSFVDLTVSQVIRAALRDFVKKSGVKTTPVFTSAKIRSKPVRDSNPVAASLDRSRLLELEDLETRNLLNKVTRAELKSIRGRYAK